MASHVHSRARAGSYALILLASGLSFACAGTVYEAVQFMYPEVAATSEEVVERWITSAGGDDSPQRVAVRIWPKWKAVPGAVHPGALNDKHQSSGRGLLHFIHVPKAGGSGFTTILRRMAGCNPPGICCKGLGTPLGVCPSFHQYCPAIQGCAGHRSAVALAMGNRGKVPTLLMMRDPVRRAVSGFFYEGHGPPDTAACPFTTCYQNATGQDGARWVDIVAKMLCDHMPYDNVVPSRTRAMSVLEHLDFVGVSELWASSLAVLYMTFPGAERSHIDFSVTGDGARGNVNADYASFRTSGVTPDLVDVTKKANEIDMALYLQAVRLLCTRLAAFGLWDLPEIQAEVHILADESTRQVCKKAAEDSLDFLFRTVHE